MNIVMVADQYPPMVGGAERQAHKLSIALTRRGHDVRVITGRWHRDMPRREVLDGVPVERLNTMFTMYGIRGVRKYSEDVFDRALLHRLRQVASSAEVFHVHALRRAARPTLQVGLERSVPVLAKERSGGPGNSYRTLPRVHRGRSLQEYFRRELRHVAVLNAEAEAEYASFGFEQLQVHRVVNGVDVDASTPVWSPADPPRLVFLGRIHPIKGAMPLLHAFAQIAAEWPDVQLRLCGEGPGLDPLRQEARGLGLDPRVETPGKVTNPLRQLAEATAVVLPSETEGMSNTLLEALAVGTPIVATAVPGNAEVLDGNLGWLVPSTDPSDLAAGIREMLRAPRERIRRSEAQRRRARERYAVDHVGQLYEELYASMQGD